MALWSSMDTRATRGSFDPDITTNQAHLPVPIKCVKFGGGRGQRCYNNLRNPKRLSCCCCCCCVSNRRLCSYTVMSFAITRFCGIRRKPVVCSLIPRPMLAEYRIVNVKSAAFSGCICPISISRRGDSRLFPKINFEGFFL